MLKPIKKIKIRKWSADMAGLYKRQKSKHDYIIKPHSIFESKHF